MRLDHVLVTLGVGSRKEVQKLIRAGRVRAEGQIIRDPSAHIPENCEMDVDGTRLDTRLTRHVMLNKPAGLLTAARDKKQRTVMDLFPPAFQTLGCMPCGRLDKDTEGLLFLTTDGELSHRLLSPNYHVEKTYLAHVEGKLTQADQAQFAKGLNLGDFVSRPSKLEIVEADETKSIARATVSEGKFHQVRRMFDAVGHPVTFLKRESFGPLSLDSALEIGKYRDLTEEEVRKLYEAAQMKNE